MKEFFLKTSTTTVVANVDGTIIHPSEIEITYSNTKERSLVFFRDNYGKPEVLPLANGVGYLSTDIFQDCDTVSILDPFAAQNQVSIVKLTIDISKWLESNLDRNIKILQDAEEIDDSLDPEALSHSIESMDNSQITDMLRHDPALIKTMLEDPTNPNKGFSHLKLIEVIKRMKNNDPSFYVSNDTLEWDDTIAFNMVQAYRPLQIGDRVIQTLADNTNVERVWNGIDWVNEQDLDKDDLGMDLDEVTPPVLWKKVYVSLCMTHPYTGRDYIEFKDVVSIETDNTSLDKSYLHIVFDNGKQAFELDKNYMISMTKER